MSLKCRKIRDIETADLSNETARIGATPTNSRERTASPRELHRAILSHQRHELLRSRVHSSHALAHREAHRLHRQAVQLDRDDIERHIRLQHAVGARRGHQEVLQASARLLARH